MDRSENLCRIRSKGTLPELAVRIVVHRLGLCFRLHRKDLPGKPDLVFVSRRQVVFFHGSIQRQRTFWGHGVLTITNLVAFTVFPQTDVPFRLNLIPNAGLPAAPSSRMHAETETSVPFFLGDNCFMARGKEDELWLTLAELFFLDAESLESDFARAADELKGNGWSRSRTEKTLVQLIAPHVAANIGWGLYPVNGEWAGFDGKVLSEKVRQSMALRAARPDWHFTLLDCWHRRLLNQLGMQNLLNRLSAPPD